MDAKCTKVRVIASGGKLLGIHIRIPRIQAVLRAQRAMRECMGAVDRLCIHPRQIKTIVPHIFHEPQPAVELNGVSSLRPEGPEA